MYFNHAKLNPVKIHVSRKFLRNYALMSQPYRRLTATSDAPQILAHPILARYTKTLGSPFLENTILEQGC